MIRTLPENSLSAAFFDVEDGSFALNSIDPLLDVVSNEIREYWEENSCACLSQYSQISLFVSILAFSNKEIISTKSGYGVVQDNVFSWEEVVSDDGYEYGDGELVAITDWQPAQFSLENSILTSDGLIKMSEGEMLLMQGGKISPVKVAPSGAVPVSINPLTQTFLYFDNGVWNEYTP